MIKHREVQVIRKKMFESGELEQALDANVMTSSMNLMTRAENQEPAMELRQGQGFH